MKKAGNGSKILTLCRMVKAGYIQLEIHPFPNDASARNSQCAQIFSEWAFSSSLKLNWNPRLKSLSAFKAAQNILWLKS